MINIILIGLLILKINKINALSSCIIFFTGGSNLITANMYTDFLSHLESDHKIIKMPFNFNDVNYISYIQELKKNYDTISYLAHSSGATTAINKINDNIDRLILMDPVATPNINYNINLDNLDSINIINVDLSYKWSYIPPFIPFIPIFQLNIDKLNIDKKIIRTTNLYNYGHSDIIDNPYRDIMHYTRLSTGNQNRKCEIYKYHNKLSNIINEIIF